MALPFFDSGSRKRPDQILAVDLGSRTTKAVHVQRRGESLALCRYALLDAPIFETTLSADLLSEHLKVVVQALDTKTKLVALAVGVNDAVVRHVEMPRMTVEDMRLVLKHNSRNYLQQDLPNHVFDCHIATSPEASKSGEPAKVPAGQKQKTLVVGAKKQLVDDYVQGARNAGLTAESLVPGLLGPVNSFELAVPEVFSREVVALVDIGFKCSSICILQEGELILSRVVGIGGDRMTMALSQSMNISYAEAEGIKVGMASEVQPALDSVLTPLGRELRASIDFFEHQQDRPVPQAYITGGSSRSESILQTLRNELMIECKTWNPMTGLQVELPSQQAAEIEQVAPQLAVALGAALAAL
jgi:type IV pilus assembly protein PilM